MQRAPRRPAPPRESRAAACRHASRAAGKASAGANRRAARSPRGSARRARPPAPRRARRAPVRPPRAPATAAAPSARRAGPSDRSAPPVCRRPQAALAASASNVAPGPELRGDARPRVGRRAMPTAARRRAWQARWAEGRVRASELPAWQRAEPGSTAGWRLLVGRFAPRSADIQTVAKTATAD